MSGERCEKQDRCFRDIKGKLIDEEVRKWVEDAYRRSKEILQENKDMLISVAERLLQKETIYKEDLEEILGKRPAATDKIALTHLLTVQ